MLSSDMQIHAKEHERPQYDSQDKGHQLADSMDRISVRQRYYHANK
jgi:hypothetical protein